MRVGRSSTFVVQRSDSGWCNVEHPRVEAEDLDGLAGEGPSIVARVLHSDVCFVLGRSGAGPDWRWVFGESSAAPYAVEFDPADWVKEDPDAREETRDQRIAETAAAVIAWADVAGLTPPAPDQLAAVLAAGYVFAEEGLFALLESLGIDAPVTEYPANEPAEEPVVIRPDPSTRDREPRAKPIDRTSDPWQRANAYLLEFRFGEPPCILQWGHSDFVLSDPPVCVGSGVADGFPGEWVPVPAEHATDFDTACAWARANIGEPGQAPTRPRPVLVRDVPPPPDHTESLSLARLHERLSPPSVEVSLELDNSFTTDAAANLARALYDRLVGQTVRSVGEEATVTYGDDWAAKGWGLVVAGGTLRNPHGGGDTKASPAAWSRVVSRLRSGELNGATCWIIRTDAYGRAAVEPFATMTATFTVTRCLASWGPEAQETSSVKVSVDLPYFRNLFTPTNAAEFVRRSIDQLPIRRGFVDVGHWHYPDNHWIDIVPASDAPDTADFPVVEQHDELLWLQRSPEPPDPITEV